MVPTSSGPDLAVTAKDKFTPVDGRGTGPQRQSALTRAGKSIWGGVKRVNKSVGEAEARLILRAFYYTVFGVVSLALRKKRRISIESEDQAEVAWSPRVSPGTDPTKQY